MGGILLYTGRFGGCNEAERRRRRSRRVITVYAGLRLLSASRRARANCVMASRLSQMLVMATV